MIKKINLKKSRKKKVENSPKFIGLHKSKEHKSLTPTKLEGKIALDTLDYMKQITSQVIKPLKDSGASQKLSIIKTPQKKIKTSPFSQNASKNQDNLRSKTKLKYSSEAKTPFKSFEKIYKLTPRNSLISNKSFINSSFRDEFSTRSNFEYLTNFKKNREGLSFVIKNSIEKFRLEYIISSHKNCINALAINNNWVFTASSDYTVKKWKLLPIFPSPYKEKEYLDGDIFKNNTVLFTHKRPVSCIAIKDNFLYSASNDGIIKQWTPDCEKTMKFIFPIKNFLMLRSYLLCSSYENIALIDNFTFRNIMNVYEKKTSCLGNFTDNQYFSGTKNGMLKLWDLRNSKYSQSIYSHSDSVTGIQNIDNIIITCSYDGYIKYWDLRNFKEVEKYYVDNEIERVLGFRNRVVTGGDGVRVWNGDERIMLYKGRCKDLIVEENIIYAAVDENIMVWSVESLGKG
ncbi:hypothetical protein SteCoe_19525 [Stentor coeruleus]|uniref:Anaphase-promoting complex subunit 4 WD40 domain-containing protein n=1 Tax=Stentor coeruleus TaxID=5963 RepID=A0A1R2BUC5_9CILI|nr:hypothetical protein SteCoe_19525 [Stentor coeruleus]